MARRRCNSHPILMRGGETTPNGEGPGYIDRSPTYISTVTHAPSYHSTISPNSWMPDRTETPFAGTATPPEPSSNLAAFSIIDEDEEPGNVSRSRSNFTRVPGYLTPPLSQPPSTVADDRTESSWTRIAPHSLASTNTTAFSNCYRKSYLRH